MNKRNLAMLYIALLGGVAVSTVGSAITEPKRCLAGFGFATCRRRLSCPTMAGMAKILGAFFNAKEFAFF